MLRSGLTALVEYLLVILVLTKGKDHKKIIAAVLFFLASYQLGEFLIFLTNGADIGISVAYFSTTLLPPLGVLLIQHITKKRFGFIIFLVIGIVLALGFLIYPDIVSVIEFEKGCIVLTQYSSELIKIWEIYYQIGLSYAVFLLIYNILKTRNVKEKNQLSLVLLGYMLFYPTAVILVKLVPAFGLGITSLMCALAIFGAITFSAVPFTKDKLEIEKLKFWKS